LIKAQQGVDAEGDAVDSVTVVICAYTEDRWPILQRAVEMALKQTGSNDELLIVIDHNDALLARCREVSDQVKVLPNHRQRGLSGARNTALGAANGSIIVFLDDDAVPLDGWLDALRAPYADRRIYGVGGYALPRWRAGRPKWFPAEFLWVVGCSYKGLPADQAPVRNLLGANMSFRKVAFDLAGDFVEQMGRVGKGVLGCEETEFSIRLTQVRAEAILMYAPSSQVEHDVPQPRTSLAYFVRRCWAEGLSKAEVTRRVGRSSGLRSERDYVARVLPLGVWTGIRQAVTGDIWGVARSAAICAGLAATTAGYYAGALSHPANGHDDPGR
jgi:cellulose synthase/poly-beta-1,6-N-acetylglucosamine synthase-like glycosyltransferase